MGVPEDVLHNSDLALISERAVPASAKPDSLISSDKSRDTRTIMKCFLQNVRISLIITTSEIQNA